MRIGTSIGMIAVGLILALAVPFDLGTINLQLVGWILALVGALGLSRAWRSRGGPGCRGARCTRRTDALHIS